MTPHILEPEVSEGRKVMSRRFATAACALCVAGGLWVLCVLAANHFFHMLVSGQRSSDPEFVVYRVDDAHRMVLGSDAALLIDTQERVVVQLSPSFARRLGPVVLWPRDVMHGVVLGDGVKGDERDSYHFGDSGVDIRFGHGDEKRDLHVPL